MSAATASGDGAKNETIVVKVGLIGDSGVGKTSLMVKYVEKRFDSDYVETLGVNFMEKTISTPSAEVTMSIWDLGGDRSYVSMMPMVCVDAVAVVFMFDLTNSASLTNIKEWYKQVRRLNKNALPFLVGTKYDLFYGLPPAEQEAISKHARNFARAMKAPLVFCSSSHGINVLKLFKLIFEMVFSIEPSIEQRGNPGEPVFIYDLALLS